MRPLYAKYRQAGAPKQHSGRIKALQKQGHVPRRRLLSADTQLAEVIDNGEDWRSASESKKMKQLCSETQLHRSSGGLHAPEGCKPTEGCQQRWRRGTE